MRSQTRTIPAGKYEFSKMTNSSGSEYRLYVRSSVPIDVQVLHPLDKQKFEAGEPHVVYAGGSDKDIYDFIVTPPGANFDILFANRGTDSADVHISTVRNVVASRGSSGCGCSLLLAAIPAAFVVYFVSNVAVRFIV